MKKSLISCLLIVSMLISCTCAGSESLDSLKKKANLQEMLKILDKLTLAYPSDFSKHENVYDCIIGIPECIAEHADDYCGLPFFFAGEVTFSDQDLFAVKTDNGKTIFLFSKYYDSKTGKVVLLEEKPLPENFRMGFFCTFWQLKDDTLVFVAGVTKEIQNSVTKYKMN